MTYDNLARRTEGGKTTSTRLTDSDRSLIEQAVLVMKRNGHWSYTLSDVLRDGGMEHAKRILGEDQARRTEVSDEKEAG